jgi:hypothetical protein
MSIKSYGDLQGCKKSTQMTQIVWIFTDKYRQISTDANNKYIKKSVIICFICVLNTFHTPLSFFVFF